MFLVFYLMNVVLKWITRYIIQKSSTDDHIIRMDGRYRITECTAGSFGVDQILDDRRLFTDHRIRNIAYRPFHSSSDNNYTLHLFINTTSTRDMPLYRLFNVYYYYSILLNVFFCIIVVRGWIPIFGCM